MAKPVDAADLKSASRKGVWVRVRRPHQSGGNRRLGFDRRPGCGCSFRRQRLERPRTRTFRSDDDDPYPVPGGAARRRAPRLGLRRAGERPDRGQRDRRRRRASPTPICEPLDPPSAFLIEAVAQGLVRFDAAGEIEPALAQSWIVSDDGLRYTFRLRRAQWADGGRVTAEQVAARLRAALSRASRNPLKPVLGAIDDDRAR